MATLITPDGDTSRVFDRLHIGTLWHAKALLQENPGVGCVLNCTREAVPRIPGVRMLQLGLTVGEAIPASRLMFTTNYLHEFFAQVWHKSVLVCCDTGTSRSPAIVLGYLLSLGMGPVEALELLKARHPRTAIEPAVQASVEAAFGGFPASVEDLIPGVLQ